MYYSLISEDGYIIQSQFTENSDYVPSDGQRILPDNSPDPAKGDYVPGVTRPVRVEPVSPHATQIEYEIVSESGHEPTDDVNQFIIDILNEQQ
jgi:hypothetical protein